MSKTIMFTTNLDDTDSQLEKTTKQLSITSVNEVYLYSDINTECSFLINKSIQELSKQLLIQQITLDLPEPSPIKLYVNSDGGEVFGAFSIVDRIRTSKVPVHSYVEGLVASAATLISTSCHKRYMYKNSIMMIHQVRSWFQGTYENFKDESENLNTITDIITKIYLSRTKFTESDLKEILKRDVYLTANDCIKYGLVDEIL